VLGAGFGQPNIEFMQLLLARFGSLLTIFVGFAACVCGLFLLLRFEPNLKLSLFRSESY
jgi:hypothetical protein